MEDRTVGAQHDKYRQEIISILVCLKKCLKNSCFKATLAVLTTEDHNATGLVISREIKQVHPGLEITFFFPVFPEKHLQNTHFWSSTLCDVTRGCPASLSFSMRRRHSSYSVFCRQFAQQSFCFPRKRKAWMLAAVCRIAGDSHSVPASSSTATATALAGRKPVVTNHSEEQKDPPGFTVSEGVKDQSRRP